MDHYNIPVDCKVIDGEVEAVTKENISLCAKDLSRKINAMMKTDGFPHPSLDSRNEFRLLKILQYIEYLRSEY